MPVRVAKIHFATADDKAACGMTARVLETTAQHSKVTCKACQQWIVEKQDAIEAQADMMPVETASKEVSMSRVIHAVKTNGNGKAPLCGSIKEEDILTHYVMQVNCGVCKGIAANSALTPAREETSNNTQEVAPMKKATTTKPAPISIVRDVPEEDTDIAELEAAHARAKAALLAKKEKARIQAEKDAAEAMAREQAQRKAEKAQHSTADIITLDVPLRSAEVSAKVSYLLALAQQGPVAIAEALNYQIVEVGAVLPPKRARVLEPGPGAVVPVEPIIVVEPEIWGACLDVVAPEPVKVWGSELDVVAPAQQVKRSTLQVFSGSGKMSKAPVKAPVVQAQARFTPGEFQISAEMGKAMLARYENGETMSALVIAYKVPGDSKNAAKMVWHAISKARKARA